jgi:hypothetical protein
MKALPDRLLDVLNTMPRTGQWHPIHQLLTAGDGPPAVCLLSSAEIRATPTTVCIAARSTTAAANLASRGFATVVSWAGEVHYVLLDLRATMELDGVHGYRFDVREVRIDALGIAVRPLQYRMEEWLVAAERWATTRAVLDALALPS